MEVGPPTIQVSSRVISGTTSVYTVSVNDVLSFSNWATGMTGFDLLFAPALNASMRAGRFTTEQYSGSRVTMLRRGRR